MSEFTESLPEDIREGAHWEGIESAEDLARSYHQAKTTKFTDTLPENLKGHEALKDMDPVKLAESYVSTIDKVPQVPKSIDEYTNPEIPQGIPIDEAANRLFREEALKAGMTNAQYQAAMQFDIQRMTSMLDSLEAQRKEAVAQIAKESQKTEEAVVKETETVAKKLGLEEMLTKRPDISSDPDFIKAMASIAAKISEDTLKFGKAGDDSVRRGADGRPILQYQSMQ
jgi:hypothetical protein